MRGKIKEKSTPKQDSTEIANQNSQPARQLKDNRPEAVTQLKLKEMTQGDSQAIQKKEEKATAKNNTGMPDALKSGIENLSGIAMDDVSVHYNSAKPAKLQAHAFAQGSQIHLASGQEKHLPHEAWHVVQQKQGRVKPTKTLGNNVSINDNVGLEKEADVMGNKAIQTKKDSSKLTNVHLNSNTAQLVKDEALRPQTDKRMNSLKDETIQILKLLKALGEDWESKYGKLAKEKASAKARSIMDREETDYPAEIRKAALRQLWSQLSPEEKLEMATEAAKLGGTALSAVVNNGWEALRQVTIDPSSSGGSSRAKTKTRDKGKQEERSPSSAGRSGASIGSVGFLSELDADDLNRLYDLYKIRKKALDRIAEAKSKIEETAGEIGEYFGEQAGKVRNEVDFNKRMKLQEQAFKVAQKRLALLQESIIENEDVDRYRDEIDALSYTLNSLNGPGMVYRFDLNEAARIKHPDLCQDAIGFIQSSSSIITRDNTFGEMLSSLGRGAKTAFESESTKEDKIALAQAQMSAALEVAIDKSWSKFTSWGWTPKAVKKIRKELPRSRSAEAKLNWAKIVASGAADKDSDNRYPETQIFYDALAKVKVKDVNSLKTATTIISQISTKLG